MTRRRELGHVAAGLGEDDVCHDGRDTWHGADQVTELAELTKGLQHHLDPLRDPGDRGVELTDAVQVDPDHERVVLTEPSGQRLSELLVLTTHLRDREVGQDLGVPLPGDQRSQHPVR